MGLDSNCCVKEFHMSAEDILARQKEFLFPAWLIIMRSL